MKYIFRWENRLDPSLKSMTKPQTILNYIRPYRGSTVHILIAIKLQSSLIALRNLLDITGFIDFNCSKNIFSMKTFQQNCSNFGFEFKTKIKFNKDWLSLGLEVLIKNGILLNHVSNRK